MNHHLLNSVLADHMLFLPSTQVEEDRHYTASSEELKGAIMAIRSKRKKEDKPENDMLLPMGIKEDAVVGVTQEQIEAENKPGRRKCLINIAA